MLTKNQTEIIYLFKKDIFQKLSILEIMKKLKKKSYQRVYESVSELVKKNILNNEKIGNSNIISLNLSEESFIELSYIEENDSINKNIPNIKKILDFNEFQDDIILITGSYSKGNYTKKSDIDLVILTKDDIIKKQKLIDNLTTLFIPKFHSMVLSYNDFTNMLNEEKDNFGKEIFYNRLILKRARLYYELLKKAIKNGFRG